MYEGRAHGRSPFAKIDVSPKGNGETSGGVRRGRPGSLPTPRGTNTSDERQVSWLPDLPTPGPSRAPDRTSISGAQWCLRFRTRLQWRGPRRLAHRLPSCEPDDLSPGDRYVVVVKKDSAPRGDEEETLLRARRRRYCWGGADGCDGCTCGTALTPGIQAGRPVGAPGSTNCRRY